MMYSYIYLNVYEMTGFVLSICINLPLSINSILYELNA